jgi:hypothetical protein
MESLEYSLENEQQFWDGDAPALSIPELPANLDLAG